ncbi:MAG TPA: prephenate dehydratase [Dehalococcoidia bacterium]|nr:prephenate dehydratase [Dehalococcoidia bacterium]
MAANIYYLGPPGSFGEQAALRFLNQQGRDFTLSPLPAHSSIVHAVNESSDDYGVVAIENSLEGAVNETMDAILHEQNVWVCHEIVLSIEQQLITAPDLDFDDIQVVMSHPQGLAQCRRFLESRLPHVRFEAALSTAGAVEEALRTPGAAAIASRLAAEILGGTIIAENIQDADNNKTRFFVLARSDAEPTGDDKTSIAFTIPDRPGSVVSVMQEFSSRGINLTRIESRPSREELGKYVFLLDFQGHRTDARPKEALAAMVESGALLLPEGRPLGSYPRFADPV